MRKLLRAPVKAVGRRRPFFISRPGTMMRAPDRRGARGRRREQEPMLHVGCSRLDEIDLAGRRPANDGRRASTVLARLPPVPPHRFAGCAGSSGRSENSGRGSDRRSRSLQGVGFGARVVLHRLGQRILVAVTCDESRPARSRRASLFGVWRGLAVKALPTPGRRPPGRATDRQTFFRRSAMRC